MKTSLRLFGLSSWFLALLLSLVVVIDNGVLCSPLTGLEQLQENALVAEIMNDFEMEKTSAANTLTNNDILNFEMPSREELREIIRQVLIHHRETEQESLRMRNQDNDDSATISSIPFLTVPELDLERMPKIKYSDLLKRAKTSDIILLSGSSAGNRLIRRMSNSPYSHVGMIYRDEAADTPYLFQSTDKANYDVRRKIATNGTQLNTLEYVENRGFPIVWRPIVVQDHSIPQPAAPVSSDEGESTPEQQQRKRSGKVPARQFWANIEMSNAIDMWSGNSFPSDPKMVVNYVLGVLGLKKIGNPDMRFCSDLVASTLVAQGYLNHKTTPWSFSPGSLSAWNRERLESEGFKIKYGEDHLIIFD